MELRMKRPQALTIIVMYRPPPTRDNGGNWNAFIDEISDLLERATQGSDPVIILGDINIHLDIGQNVETLDFLHLLYAFELEQHITTPTHQRGHILDVLITRENCPLITKNSVKVTDTGICNDQGHPSLDHYAISFEMTTPKPALPTKSMTDRALKKIVIADLSKDALHAAESSLKEATLEDTVAKMNKDPRLVSDKHAPQRSRIITIRPNTQHTPALRQEKRTKRSIERRWKKRN
jgi:hypothetical protein